MGKIIRSLTNFVEVMQKIEDYFKNHMNKDEWGQCNYKKYKECKLKKYSIKCQKDTKKFWWQPGKIYSGPNSCEVHPDY